MKVREIISLVRNELNTISLDDKISNRFIFNKIINYADFFIKRESDTRRIFNSTNLFTINKFFELKPYQNNYKSKCSNLSKSVKEIPDFYSSIYGNLLIVESIDNSIRFEQTTSENYKNIIKREFKPKNGYFWIENNHLILSEDVKAVTIKYLAKINMNVKDILNKEINIPEWLISDIIKYTVTDIRNTKGIPKDENPDLNYKK